MFAFACGFVFDCLFGFVTLVGGCLIIGLLGYLFWFPELLVWFYVYCSFVIL